MFSKSITIRLALTFVLAGLAAQAATIFDITTSVGLTNPTQTGRLSRNGIAQDWTNTESFPGIINPATVYHYATFSVNVGSYSYVQIEFDDVAGNAATFVSAYDTRYLPDSNASTSLGFDTNWLGDPGGSGNDFGTDPQFFQVIVPANHTLVVVVNNSNAANGGVGDAFHLTVEGFLDSGFNDTVPEPAGFVLMGGGLALLAVWRKRRGGVRQSA